MKNLFQTLTLILAMLALSGCPGKSSSNKNEGTVCVNCGITAANQVSFSGPMTSIINQGTLTLSLTGDSAQLSYLTNYRQNPIFAYQGQSTVTGSLNLSYDLIFGSCRLPRGQYQISTIVTPGTYVMGVFEFPQVQLVGPVTMTAAIVDGVILTDGLGNIRGMGALLYGLTGLPAVQNWYSNNTQIPCGDGIGVRF